VSTRAGDFGSFFVLRLLRRAVVPEPGARTIRFYIAPRSAEWFAKVGRVPECTAEHVVRLERIKRLQADGRTLLEIGRILSGPSAAMSAMEPPTARWQHAIADDVIVWVRDGASPWRTKRLRAAVEEFARPQRHVFRDVIPKPAPR
jgi:hypothetical protein